MTMRNAFFALAFVLSAICFAEAGVTRVDAVQTTDAGDVLPDFTVNDIVMDFSTDVGLGFQQLILELTQGSIFQETSFGTNGAPNGALIGVEPKIEFDTFVTVGGLVAADSSALLEIGGAVNIVPGSAKKFDAEGLNITWSPGTGVFITEGTDYVTSRITLSDDAVGSLRYIGTTSDDAPWWEGEASIMDGVISFDSEPPVGPVLDPLPTEPILAIIGDTVELLVDADQDIETWAVELSGDPAVAPTIVPGGSATFSWDTTGSAPGLYTATISATNANGTGTGTFEINVAVPEPATFALAGLALFGLVGFARRK